jgi:serine/threonine protein kinase
MVASSAVKLSWPAAGRRTFSGDSGHRLEGGDQQLNLFDRFGADGDSGPQVLWEDGDRVLCRGWRQSANGERDMVLIMLPAAEHPTPANLDRLAHAYALRNELEDWAVRPLALVRESGRTMLVLEDPGGEPLARQLGAPMEVERFLRLAVGISAALGKLHRRGLVHKDLKPAKILVDCADGRVRLTGFGLVSRLPREHQAPEPLESIAGTLTHMAPEQTGRMNRSIDSRSDLYSAGIILYQMLTGSLPFTATDPMGWAHCHVARRPVPPAERVPGVPAVLSAIIMKLLSKGAEDRYQTAAGLESDLRRCLTERETQRRINDFPLGEKDTSDRLFIPEKLYGREREIATLLAAFDRVRSWCWFPAIPGSASLRSSMNCIKCLFRHAGYSPRVSSTNTSATPPTRRSRRLFRALFGLFVRGAKPRVVGATPADRGSG